MQDQMRELQDKYELMQNLVEERHVPKVISHHIQEKVAMTRQLELLTEELAQVKDSNKELVCS
jgi:hypothetical protein